MIPGPVSLLKRGTAPLEHDYSDFRSYDSPDIALSKVLKQSDKAIPYWPIVLGMVFSNTVPAIKISTSSRGAIKVEVYLLPSPL